jgi:hypothetical protein
VQQDWHAEPEDETGLCENTLLLSRSKAQVEVVTATHMIHLTRENGGWDTIPFSPSGEIFKSHMEQYLTIKNHFDSLFDTCRVCCYKCLVGDTG